MQNIDDFLYLNQTQYVSQNCCVVLSFLSNCWGKDQFLIQNKTIIIIEYWTNLVSRLLLQVLQVYMNLSSPWACNSASPRTWPACPGPWVCWGCCCCCWPCWLVLFFAHGVGSGVDVVTLLVLISNSMIILLSPLSIVLSYTFCCSILPVKLTSYGTWRLLKYSKYLF